MIVLDRLLLPGKSIDTIKVACLCISISCYQALDVVTCVAYAADQHTQTNDGTRRSDALLVFEGSTHVGAEVAEKSQRPVTKNDRSADAHAASFDIIDSAVLRRNKHSFSRICPAGYCTLTLLPRSISSHSTALYGHLYRIDTSSGLFKANIYPACCHEPDHDPTKCKSLG